MTGGFDNKVRFWDLQSQQPKLEIQLPDKVLAMDVRGVLLVVCMPEKQIHMFNLSSNTPNQPFRKMTSPLKRNARCCRVMTTCDGFIVGSEEGRCAVRYADESKDTQRTGGGFNFKCHRDGEKAYPVHAGGRFLCFSFQMMHFIALHFFFCLFAVDWQPSTQCKDVFVTAGGDSTWATWDKSKLARANGCNKMYE